MLLFLNSVSQPIWNNSTAFKANLILLNESRTTIIMLIIYIYVDLIAY